MSADRLDALSAARALVDARRNGRTVAAVKSLTGATAGHHVLVFADGLLGSLGSAALDDAARRAGLEALAARQPVLHAVEDQQLFAEPYLPADHLIIVGAGHIAVPLAQTGVLLGMSVTVLDDRVEFATEERFPEQATVLRMDFEQPFHDVPIDGHSYVVLVTRAHKYDFACLREILAHDAQPKYIGMIGSRRRVRAAFHALLEGGLAAEKLARVHAPVGLDVGAETPAEIAVSIAAELVRARSGTGTCAPLGESERVLERFFAGRENDA